MKKELTKNKKLKKSQHMDIQNKTMQACIVNTEQEPKEVKHICFYTQIDGHRIHLIKVEELVYLHPDSAAVNVSIIKTRVIGTRNTNEFEAAPYMILHYAQQNAAKAR